MNKTETFFLLGAVGVIAIFWYLQRKAASPVVPGGVSTGSVPSAAQGLDGATGLAPSPAFDVQDYSQQ